MAGATRSSGPRARARHSSSSSAVCTGLVSAAAVGMISSDGMVAALVPPSASSWESVNGRGQSDAAVMQDVLEGLGWEVPSCCVWLSVAGGWICV
jgi:hypothetical protein